MSDTVLLLSIGHFSENAGQFVIKCTANLLYTNTFNFEGFFFNKKKISNEHNHIYKGGFKKSILLREIRMFWLFEKNNKQK